VGLNAITKELWDVAHNTEDKRKDTSLSTCKRMLINELDLLTNATVVDDAT
jgi:hypothetical protein